MGETVIEIRDLTKRYGATVGVEGLDLTVRLGDVFGFLGPNGAGKTTTIRLLLDLIRPTRGWARLFGSPVGRPALRRRVGYLPGELTLDQRLSGNRMLAFLAALHGADHTREAAERRDALCERLGLKASDRERRVRDYSRGMKQKLGLVSALQHDPDLLILDEPTTGLDPLVRETVFEILIETGRRGKTVFHSSHVLSEVERTCNRVAIVRQGRLLSVRNSEEMRHASVRRMVIRFEGDPPLAELELPGVELIEQRERCVVLRVAGSLNPLLGVLSRHAVRDLAFPEPSLEEAFVEMYRSDPREPK
jgi:ABC-2 type transport system ATP-binding protein